MPQGDTQADLTERARHCANNFYGWFCGHTNYEQIVGFIAAALQSEREAATKELRAFAEFDKELIANLNAEITKARSEREAAAAETRKIIQDLVENFGAGGPKANKAFAVATRYLLASPEWRLKWARAIDQRDANRREAEAELEAISKERDAVTGQRDRATAVVRLYLDTYADTQKHPTASQEAAVIVAARAALDTPSSPSLPESPIDG